MKRVLLIGASGRMGKELSALLLKAEDFKLQMQICRHKPFNLGPHCTELGHVNPAEIDLVIDFSTSAYFMEVLDWCVQNRKTLISGTTGLKEEHFQKMQRLSQDVPVLWSSNMSVGVAVLNKMLHHFGVIGDWDIHVEETHHIHKKDRPSGTAITLQKTVQICLPHKKVPIQSFREGEVFGVHKVIAKSEEEILTIKHEALNRSVFAKGALRCADWIVRQPAGYYNISQALGLE